jgi:segregation and condensation protein A
MTDAEDQNGQIWSDEPLRHVEPVDSDALIVDVGGFEGPLDLLLELARTHKIDLGQISILALANQYLGFIEKAQALRLDIAADYLVMAAWLAYLKSRLLLPKEPTAAEGGSAQDMAAHLAFRLQRLQAMREKADAIFGLPQLGRDIFQRGEPEPLMIQTQRTYSDTLVDLLKAYAERRARTLVKQTYTIKKQPVWSIKEAREKLMKLVGVMDDWGSFDRWLARYLATPETRRSVRASSFTASLELAREGLIEIRQDEAFQPIYLRRRPQAA